MDLKCIGYRRLRQAQADKQNYSSVGARCQRLGREQHGKVWLSNRP